MWDYGQESGRGGRDGQRSETIIMAKAGQQKALQKQAQSQRRSVYSRAITTADRGQSEQDKVDRFIGGKQCRQIFLDQEIDGRIDCVGCEDGEEKCDICQKDDQAMAEAEVLQRAYIVEQNQMLDSSINILSSSFEMPASDKRHRAVAFTSGKATAHPTLMSKKVVTPVAALICQT
jgi:superfamily II DNA helicase RecQ